MPAVDTLEYVVDLLLAYWREEHLPNRTIRNTCRLLANKVALCLPEGAHRDRATVGQVLSDLSRRDPEARAWIAYLMERESPVASQFRQEVSVSGEHNVVITAGRDVTIQDKPGPLLQQAAREMRTATPSERLVSTERQSLRRAIIDHFEEDELRSLCHEFDVDYDHLPGEGKAGKVRELMIRIEEAGRLPEWVALCRESRPGTF